MRCALLADAKAGVVVVHQHVWVLLEPLIWEPLCQVDDLLVVSLPGRFSKAGTDGLGTERPQLALATEVDVIDAEEISPAELLQILCLARIRHIPASLAVLQIILSEHLSQFRQ